MFKPRKTYALDLLRDKRSLTFPSEPELIDCRTVETVAAVCRQQFFMSPVDADRAARLAVHVPDLTVSDLDTLDAMLRREN